MRQRSGWRRLPWRTRNEFRTLCVSHIGAKTAASPAEQLQIDRVMLAWLRSHKRWQDGLAVVDRLMRHPQGRENLWDVKTKILIGLKQYENAKSWSLAAENLEPLKVDPLALVGHTAMVQGDWNESLRIFRRARGQRSLGIDLL